MKRFPFSICLLLVLLLVTTGVQADTVATTTATTTTIATMPTTYGPPTLSSITPWTGVTNTTISITSLAGTNFGNNAGFRLRRASYKDIVGSVDSVNSTRITGTINLDKQHPGDYEVCVFNDASTYTCGLTFTVTTPSETVTSSSIFFETNPTGAIVLLNGTKIGTSAFTYHNATPGTFKVLIQKSGYEDYTGSVTVAEGKHSRYYASLAPRGAGTMAVTGTPVITATTFRKSTLKVPTSWPTAADTTTQASPADPAFALGAAAAGAGILVMRRR
jgi:PEGA domain